MNENEGILELVEMLYNMISEAWGVPLGNDKCLVDRDKALDLIDEASSRVQMKEYMRTDQSSAEEDSEIGRVKAAVEAAITEGSLEKAAALREEQIALEKAQKMKKNS